MCGVKEMIELDGPHARQQNEVQAVPTQLLNVPRPGEYESVTRLDQLRCRSGREGHEKYGKA